MADPGKLGGKLGPRLADHMHRAATAHLRSTAATRARIHTQGVLGVFRTMTGESRGTTSRIYRRLADHPDTPEQLRPLFAFMTHGAGELQAVLSALTTAQSLTPGIGQLISNDLAPVIQDTIAHNPNALLDPATAARAIAVGLWEHQEGVREGGRQGLEQSRFETLVELARAFPDAATIMELARRGTIGRDLAHQWLMRGGLDAGTANYVMNLERQYIPPAMAADMVLRGVLNEASGREIARVQGITAGDFDAMVLDTGEPPAVEQLLFLYRRGKIDRTRLVHGIRQSRVRNEWIDAVEALQHQPMDTGSAVAAVVQGHLSDPEGQAIATENGLEPAHWRPLVETHGRPPGAQEMLQLLNRGEATQAQVEQAIRESDIKDKYIPALLKIRRHLMPERTVVSAIGKGVFTERQGIDHLLNLGFNAADAKALASEASKTKTAGHKTLAEGTILRLYQAHTISREQAHAAILKLGYSGTETDWILAFVDVRRVEEEKAHLVGVLRSRFVAHHIDANAVLADGGAAGVPHAELERLLRMWELERSANARQLTEAQVVRAHKKGFLSDPDANGRLIAMGYSADDAALLLKL